MFELQFTPWLKDFCGTRAARERPRTATAADALPGRLEIYKIKSSGFFGGYARGTQFVHGRSRMTTDPRIPTLCRDGARRVFTNQHVGGGGEARGLRSSKKTHSNNRKVRKSESESR